METHTVVICTENSGYEASLELKKLYEVIPDPRAAAHEQTRIIDESGEDYLYPRSFFTRIDLPQEIIQHIFRAA